MQRVLCDPVRRSGETNWSRIGGWKADGILNESGDVFGVNDFNRLFQIQGGRCKLCNKHQSEFDRNLCVDHDAETGHARGLLCMLCNRNMVGKHTLETAMKLVAYLQNNFSKARDCDSTDTKIAGNECGGATATQALSEVGPSQEGNSVSKVNPHGKR